MPAVLRVSTRVPTGEVHTSIRISRQTLSQLERCKVLMKRLKRAATVDAVLYEATNRYERFLMKELRRYGFPIPPRHAEELHPGQVKMPDVPDSSPMISD